jgi:lipopolysaccharide heptosyltransferase I
MHILIVKLGSIGDIVHTLPSLAAIRRALPRARLSWVVEKRSSAILQSNPLLDHLIEVDTKALRRWPTSGETLLAPRQQFRRLRASSFDLAIDFQGLLKSSAIARLSGAKRVFGFSRAALREPASRLLLSRTVKTPSHSHVIEKNLALTAGALNIDVPTSSEGYEFPISVEPTFESEAAAVIPARGAPFAILNPGGGWVTKLWEPERFGALADVLWTTQGISSLISYGPGENDLASRAVAASRTGQAKAVTLSLKGFFALARRATVYVGGDTGPTHLAVASNTPVVGLFGPTEWWRNGSPHPDDICVERNEIDCRVDCHRRTCGNWICMDIGVDRVARAVEERLSLNNSGKGALISVGT